MALTLGSAVSRMRRLPGDVASENVAHNGIVAYALSSEGKLSGVLDAALRLVRAFGD